MNETEASNVIKFPKLHKLGIIPENEDDVYLEIAGAKMQIFEELADFYWQRFCNEISLSGLSDEIIESEEFLENLYLIRESIIAAFCKGVGVDHELHETAKAITGLKYPDGEHLPEAIYLDNEE